MSDKIHIISCIHETCIREENIYARERDFDFAEVRIFHTLRPFRFHSLIPDSRANYTRISRILRYRKPPPPSPSMRMGPKVGARRSFVKLTFISCPLVARKLHGYRANSAACARERQTYFEKHAYISKISESSGYLAFVSRRFAAAVSFRITTGIMAGIYNSPLKSADVSASLFRVAG